MLTVIYRRERAGFHYLLSNVANGDATMPGNLRVQLRGDDHARCLHYMSRAVAASWVPPHKPALSFAQHSHAASRQSGLPSPEA